MTLHAGTMPDLHGCPGAVVEQALRVTEIRSEIATGPSAVAAGAVYAQAPAPGSAIQPGMVAMIRVSDGTTPGNSADTNSAGDGTVAGASAGGPAATDAMPASVAPQGNDAPGGAPPNDAFATGSAPIGSATADTAPTDSPPTDSAPADPGIADYAPPADAPGAGASTGDLPADIPTPDSTADGTTTGGRTSIGVAQEGSTTTGDAMPADAIAGVAAPVAAEPGNVAGLVATPAGAASTVPVPEPPGSTSVPDNVAAMPGWWWAVLALALTLILAGVAALVRQRRIKWQRPAWEQRVHAQGLLGSQGSAMPVGEIPLATMPFSVAASLGVGEVTVHGAIPTRTQET